MLGVCVCGYVCLRQNASGLRMWNMLECEANTRPKNMDIISLHFKRLRRPLHAVCCNNISGDPESRNFCLLLNLSSFGCLLWCTLWFIYFFAVYIFLWILTIFLEKLFILFQIFRIFVLICWYINDKNRWNFIVRIFLYIHMYALLKIRYLLTISRNFSPHFI